MAKAAKPKTADKPAALPDQGVLTTLVAAHISGHGKPPTGEQLDDLVATAIQIAAIAAGETGEPEEEN